MDQNPCIFSMLDVKNNALTRRWPVLIICRMGQNLVSIWRKCFDAQRIFPIRRSIFCGAKMLLLRIFAKTTLSFMGKGRGPNSLNFPYGNFQCAKTFQTKCVNRFRDKKTRKSFWRQKKCAQILFMTKSPDWSRYERVAFLLIPFFWVLNGPNPHGSRYKRVALFLIPIFFNPKWSKSSLVTL